MSVLRLNRRWLPGVAKLRPFSTLPESEYTAVPHYPEILDLSYEAKRERARAAVHQQIKEVKTVEEKQIKINMPRYYGFKQYILEENYIPYNQFDLAQHTTRTHLIQNDSLPDFYPNVEDDAVSSLKSSLEEALLFELEGYKRAHDITGDKLEKEQAREIIVSALVKQINRVLVTNLTKKSPHLLEAQLDLDSRIEAFWHAGGMEPPNHIRASCAGIEWKKHLADEPIDRVMNYLGTAKLSLRCNKPLRPIMPHQNCESDEYVVPEFTFDPRTVGVKVTHKHLANIPGFWPGDPNQFGIVSYHCKPHRKNYKDPRDDKEAVHRQGILASFAWLNCQANFLGFTTFNDITYPLVTQTVVTDGQFWSFYAYQLNTLLFHTHHYKNNPKKNICWATPELKLYEEIKEGKLVGFNDAVMKNLVKFYSNAPETRLGVNMTPYLSKEEKLIADYQDDEKRQWLEKEYKYLMGNKGRFALIPEVYDWERIYKIQNETRFMEPRRRPFELKQDPWKRTLDARKPYYIPRALRPDLPRHKGRNAKEFWP